MTVYSLGGFAPDISDACWVAPTADVIGRVRMLKNSSVWFHAIVRGDNDLITIGEGSNIQDGCVLHTDPGLALTIGDNCTIGHGAIIHGCTIGNGTLVGMGATILNRAKIGANCLIGAQALIPEGKEIPDRSLVLGAPGKVVRSLNDDDVAGIIAIAESYCGNWLKFAGQLNAL